MIKVIFFALTALASGMNCQDKGNQNQSACMGSRPAYCENDEFQNALACFNANPAYCANSVYQNSLACAGTKPAYCKKSEFNNAGACQDLARFCQNSGRVTLADCLAFALKNK